MSRFVLFCGCAAKRRELVGFNSIYLLFLCCCFFRCFAASIYFISLHPHAPIIIIEELWYEIRKNIKILLLFSFISYIFFIHNFQYQDHGHTKKEAKRTELQQRVRGDFICGKKKKYQNSDNGRRTTQEVKENGRNCCVL